LLIVKVIANILKIEAKKIPENSL